MDKRMKKTSLLLLAAALGGQANAQSYSPADICKATISVEMSRDASSMKTGAKGDQPQISYTRDDGEVFKYRCRIDGNTVVWRAFFSDTKEWGRWRNSYETMGDAKTTFSIIGDNLVITNDQIGEKTFDNKDF